MRRLGCTPLRGVLAALLLTLLLGGAAQAQGNWAGLRTGYPFGLALHYGIDDAVGANNDLRVTGRIWARGGSASFGIGLDYMTTLVTERPFELYVGAGPAIGFSSGGSFFLDVHGLIGGEFRFYDLNLPELGIFVEGAIGATIRSNGNATVPDGGATIGFNWHF